MTFAEPAFLLGLLLVPLALLAQAASRHRARNHAVRFPAVSTLKLAAGTVPAWRRYLPPALALAALAALGTYAVHGLFRTYIDLEKVAVPFWASLGVLAALQRDVEPQS